MWPSAGQRKVARPGQPVDGFGFRAFGGGEPRHFGKSAGNDRRARVVAEAEAYEAEVVNRAAGDASRFDQVYQAYRLNPDVTKERIYIETVEEIFSNVEKIIIDEPSGGSGVVPYLPLRELNKSSGGN